MSKVTSTVLFFCKIELTLGVGGRGPWDTESGK